MSFLIAPVALLIGGLPWLSIAGARLGRVAGPPTVGAGVLAALLLAMVVTPALRIDVTVTAVATGAALLIAGIAVGRRTGTLLRPPGAAARSLWLPALLGAVIWVGAVVVGRVVPGGAGRAWALDGDTVNNLQLALESARDSGVVFDPEGNPVPTIAMLLAPIVAPFRPVGRAAAMAHDFDAAVVLWSLLIAATCVVVGATLAAALPAANPRRIAAVSALGSLLPLTWFVTGIPLQWGWMNAHLALPLVLTAWLVQRGASRHPLAVLVVQSVLATLLLATWSPLAFVPIAFGVVGLLRAQAALRGLRGRRFVPMVLGAGQLIAWVLLSTVPATIAQRRALASEGQAAPSMMIPLLVLALGMLVAGLVIRRRRPDLAELSDALLATAAATGIGIGLLFAIAREDSDPIGSYYPAKFAWLMTVVLVILLLSVLVPRLAARRAVAGVGLVAAAVVAATLVPVPPAHLDPTVRVSPAALVAGGIWNRGDATVDRVLELAARPGTTLLWDSGDPDEAMIDFLLIVTGTGAVRAESQMQRQVAYDAWVSFRDTGLWPVPGATFCVAISELDDVTLITTDDELVDILAERCALTPRIELVPGG